MKKALPIISYLIYIAAAAWYAISSKIELDKLQGSSSDSLGEGLANGFGGLGLAIAMILGLGYGAVALVALLIKVIHNASGWMLFGLLSVILDLAFTALHAYVTYSTVAGAGELIYTIIFGVLTIISVVSLISSCSSLK